MPQITVIVPNYNHSPYLEQRLQSIYNQTFQDFEVLLLDDCSTDNSREILNNYSKHPKTSHCIFNKENSGSPFKQWAKGISLAQGEFIWIAESDDIADLHFLERMVPKMQNSHEVSLVNCLSAIINSQGNLIKKQSEWEALKNSEVEMTMEGVEFIMEFMIHSNPLINASACLFRKKSMEKIPFGKINFKLNGDWLIYILLLRSSKITLIPEYLNHFRTHQQSVRTILSHSIPHKEHLRILKFLKEESIIPIGLLKKHVYSPLFTVLNIDVDNGNYLNSFSYFLKTTRKMELFTPMVLLQYIKYRVLKRIQKK